MALHAKPSGGYSEGTAEWTDNINALWSYCRSLGYSEEAFSGMMGNAQHEGGLNPWRWEGDRVRYNRGYGLFQYTPASGYLNNYGKVSPYYAPNLSTSGQTSGASPNDGYAQIQVIQSSGKFFGGGVRDRLVAPYVSGYSNYKTIDGFKTIQNVHDATYIWLSYFEMPGWWYSQTNVSINAGARETSADNVYKVITGTTPEPPDPGPGPEPEPGPGWTDEKLRQYGAYREIIRRLILHA